ncbi:MAG: AbrB/MazE/SpoVT family DNA-binding domain-containing protein [Trueperaceae bacterium]
MIALATVSSKGQVTIPMEVRKRLGLKQGDRVEFIMENGLMIFRPVRAIDNPFQAYAGALGGFENSAEVVAWQRELRDED